MDDKKEKKPKRGQGQGSIVWVESRSAYMAQYIDPVTNARKTFYRKSHPEAEKELWKRLNEYEEGGIVYTDKTTVKDWLEFWLETYRISRLKPIKPTTRDGYRWSIDNYLIPAFGSMDIRRLTRDHVQRWFNSLAKDKAATATKAFKVLNMAMAAAVPTHVKYNPCAGVNVVLPEKPKELPKHFESGSFVRFMKAVTASEYESFYLLGVLRALRIGEIVGLRYTDIDFQKKEIHIQRNVVRVKRDHSDGGPKTELLVQENSAKSASSLRTLPLPDVLIDSLKRRMELQNERIKKRIKRGVPIEYAGSEYIFPGNDWRGPMDGNTFLTRQLYPLLESAGIPKIPFHGLRHTVATLAAEGGLNAKEIQELLGHADSRITEAVYIHLTSAKQKINADKLDAYLEKLIQDDEAKKEAERQKEEKTPAATEAFPPNVVQFRKVAALRG